MALLQFLITMNNNKNLDIVFWQRKLNENEYYNDDSLEYDEDNYN